MKYIVLLIIFLILSSLQNTNAQWSNSYLGLTGRAIQCFTTSNSFILAGTDGGLVRSTDNGTSWANYGGGLPYTNIKALLNIDSYPFNLLAGMVSGRISKSTDYGNDWTGFPTDNEQLPFLANINCILERSNNSNFLVGSERGVYLLPQYYPISNWIPINTGLPSSETKVRSLIEKDGEVFAGTNSGVFLRNGSSWDEKNIGLSNTNVTTLNSIDTILIAGTSQGSTGGVYISSDMGNNWTLSLEDPWITSILIIGSNIFAGSFGNGVWRSTNFGNIWNQINDGLASGAYYVLSLGRDNQYLFAGTNGSNIWRRPLSQVVTDVETENSSYLDNFSLEQNYPNPFNPCTKIRYKVSTNSQVSIKVYDVLGNEVTSLVNEFRPAGSYEVTFDASKFSSGVYMYKLVAFSSIDSKKFSSTKKLVLLK